MLDEARNNLISHAFRKANITSLESEPTAAEIEDAAHTLNNMLQSWNNDGFRLFKIKTGFMPFLPYQNDYALATQAYKHIEPTQTLSVDTIGATYLHVANMSNMAHDQRIAVINTTASDIDIISNIDFANALVELTEPLSMSGLDNDAVFYGQFSIGTTEAKAYVAPFGEIPCKPSTLTPNVGDYAYFCYNGTWIKKKIISVNLATNVISFEGTQLAAGSVTSGFVIYGPNVNMTYLVGDHLMSERQVNVSHIENDPKYINIPVGQGEQHIYEVESFDKTTNKIILKEAVPEDVLVRLGKYKIKADKLYQTQTEVSWVDLLEVLPPAQLDWGSITQAPSAVDEWGYVTSAATVLEDWGTLTGNARIAGFGATNTIGYVLVQDSENNNYYLFWNYGSGWEEIPLPVHNTTHMGLYTADGNVYLYSSDSTYGLRLVSNNVLTTILSEETYAIIQYRGDYYLFGDVVGQTRHIRKTRDFNNFEDLGYVTLPSIDNPAEFHEKMYIGKTDTYVGDMTSFYNVNVFSEARCVIGDRLLNLNTSRVCSYTLNGVDFLPMPVMLSNQSAWGSKDDCSFIGIYGAIDNETVSTRIFTANDFNPVWTPQVVVPGRVFEIFFDDYYAYFVSDIAVVSLLYRRSIEPVEPVDSYLFGERIGRPQQVMNVMKYGFNNQVELPMNALSLQEFTLLPRSGLGGEPVNYCFFKDAVDGKMMVWGTPTKFGEYLRFSYVEPITLLENARSTPDFPGEYYEAVEDGLAAELAIIYGAPLERQQALAAKAAETKENAMLHDNEDTSYNIVPNQRWI